MLSKSTSKDTSMIGQVESLCLSLVLADIWKPICCAYLLRWNLLWSCSPRTLVPLIRQALSSVQCSFYPCQCRCWIAGVWTIHVKHCMQTLTNHSTFRIFHHNLDRELINVYQSNASSQNHAWHGARPVLQDTSIYYGSRFSFAFFLRWLRRCKNTDFSVKLLVLSWSPWWHSLSCILSSLLQVFLGLVHMHSNRRCWWVECERDTVLYNITIPDTELRGHISTLRVCGLNAGENPLPRIVCVRRYGGMHWEVLSHQ